MEKLYYNKEGFTKFMLNNMLYDITYLRPGYGKLVLFNRLVDKNNILWIYFNF